MNMHIAQIGKQSVNRDGGLPRSHVIASCESCVLVLFGISFGVSATTQNPLYIGELISAVLLVVYICSRRFEKVYDQFRLQGVLAAMCATALGYIVTDLMVGTPVDDLTRGWARLAVTIANTLALVCVVYPRIKKLDKIAIGFAASSIASSLFANDKFVWKFDGATPLAILAAALATCLSPLPGTLVLLTAGIINLALDCRNAGGISIIVAAIVFARMPSAIRRKLGFLPIFGVAVLAIGGLYAGYRLALNDYSHRQAESNADRRADIEIAIGEIASSPIIGHGSWFYSADMQAAIAARYAELTGKTEPAASADISAGHSAVLQTWFEGGMFGATFFIVLILRSLGEIPHQFFKPAYLPISPLFVTLIAAGVWDLMMSPFAGIHRVTISLGTAALFATRYGDRVLALRFRPVQRKGLQREVVYQS